MMSTAKYVGKVSNLEKYSFNGFSFIKEESKSNLLITGYVSLIVGRNNKVLSFCSYQENMICKLETLSEYRGKGFASYLLKQVVKNIFSDGEKRVKLYPISNELIPFYKKFGFQVVPDLYNLGTTMVLEKDTICEVFNE